MVKSPPTRVVSLDAGQARDRRPNWGTTAFSAMPEWVASPPSFEDLFLRYYGGIRDAFGPRDAPGVALAAIDLTRGCLAGTLWIAGKPGEINSAIVGRHDRADLFLDDEPAMSLRHVAVILHPLAAWDGSGVRYRLVDLRTQLPLVDERRRRFDALEATGPIFVFAGRYALLCLVTGDADGWPEDPRRAWSLVPPRVHDVADETVASRWRAAAPPPWSGRSTVVTLRLGPSAAEEQPLCLDDEARAGWLTVASGDRSRRQAVGARSLEHGVLVGSYARCDDRVIGPDVGVSRVHLALFGVGDRVWAIDTASTNGSFIEPGPDGARVRNVALDREAEIHLAGGARITWTPEGDGSPPAGGQTG